MLDLDGLNPVVNYDKSRNTMQTPRLLCCPGLLGMQKYEGLRFGGESLDSAVHL